MGPGPRPTEGPRPSAPLAWRAGRSVGVDDHARGRAMGDGSRVGGWIERLGAALTRERGGTFHRCLRWTRHPSAVLAAAMVAAFLCGVGLHPRALVLAAALGATLLIGVAWPWLSTRGLSGSLRFDRARAREGDPVAGRLSVRNLLPCSAWGLTVRGVPVVLAAGVLMGLLALPFLVEAAWGAIWGRSRAPGNRPADGASQPGIGAGGGRPAADGTADSPPRGRRWLGDLALADPAARRYAIEALRLVERRSKRAGCPRPPGRTPASWYGSLATSPAEGGGDLAGLVRLAEWGLHAPPNVAPPAFVEGDSTRDACRRALRGWTLRRLRVASRSRLMAEDC